MVRAMSSALDARAQLKQDSYDGVRGQPPGWLPAPLADEFFAARDNLLNDHSVNEVARWMDACQALGSYPFAYVKEIEALVYIKQIASLGESDGIDAYMGRGQYRVRRAFTERAPRPEDVIAGYNQDLTDRGRQLGGLNRGHANTERDRKLRDEAQRLSAQGKANRAIPAILARTAKLSHKQVKRILKKGE
jgi:hypothetical protein